MHTLRILADSANPSRTLTDSGTGNRPFWWRGSDIRIQIALAESGAHLVSTDIGTIIVEVKPLNSLPGDATLMRKTYGPGDCDVAYTSANWGNGASQLLTATFTDEEAHLPPGSYLLIIRHEDAEGLKSTHASTEVTVLEDSSESPSIADPPPIPAEYWTKPESDSRYAPASYIEPVMLTANPVSQDEGEITGTLTPDATGSFTLIHNVDIGEDEPVSLYSTTEDGSLPATRIYHSGSAWLMQHFTTGASTPSAVWTSDPISADSHPGQATGWTPLFGLGIATPTGTPTVTYTPITTGLKATVTIGETVTYWVNKGTLLDPIWELEESDVLESISREVTKMRYVTSPLWRLIRRSAEPSATTSDHNKFRLLSLGDSLEIAPATALAKRLGYGGKGEPLDSSLYTPISGSDAYTAPLTSAHQYTALQTLQFSRVPNSLVYQLNTAAGDKLHFEQAGFFHSVYVSYLANTGHGKFKVQYRTVKTGGWTDLTAAWQIKSGTNSGTDETAGILSTDNGTTEKYCVAGIEIPAGINYYDIRIIPTVGNVYITEVHFNAGGLLLGTGSNADNTQSGALTLKMARGGTSVSQQKATPLAVWQTVAAAFDPHVITWRGDESHSDLATFQTHWPEYSAKLLEAFPRAVIFVFGSSIRFSQPDRDDAAALAVDNYLREWCEENDQVFVDIRQFMPEYLDDSSLDDLWADGLHTENIWFNAILMDILAPVFAQWGALSSSTELKNYVRPARENFNQIDLYDRGVPTSDPFYNALLLKQAPRGIARLLFAGSSAHYFLGNKTVRNGVGVAATDALHALPSCLLFEVGGQGYMGIIRGDFHGGGVFGMAVSASSSLVSNGWVFIAPRANRSALNAVGMPSQTANIFNIYREGAQNGTSLGNVLWSWAPNGSVIYEGLTVNSFQTTFTYEEPLADATLHTPVCATAGTGGTHTRVIGVVPSYPTEAAGLAAVGVGRSFWSEADKEVITRLS